ncbi:PIR protein, putative [Plasmodium sp. DRC-Itaito]|nr:PIR protein, putative [Plasmodium sp. DRC-Itaito]
MKVHYFNILLFDLPLNILVDNHRNHDIARHHTPKIPTTRSLCECELYAPANYDSDAQMKIVMQQFDDRTTQRLRDYYERMQSKRMQCKERCDKESQKIILKDKLEKELMDKFVTLDTDIQSDAIPTCLCERSVADKTEKFCLNCGKNMGAIAPWWGLVCGAWYAGWINAATATAIELATQEGIKAGIAKVIAQIKGSSIYSMLSDVQWPNFINGSNYSTSSGLFKAVESAIDACERAGRTHSGTIGFARSALSKQKGWFGPVAEAGQEAARAKTADLTPIYTTKELSKVTSTGAILSDPIIISAIVVVTIAVILLIIYLILRYRRKKKMKKKLQYIKLLEE